VPRDTRVAIAFVLPRFHPGGTERQMLELVRRLDTSRWNVHVACFRTEGAWFDRVPASATVVRFPVTSLRQPSLLRHMWRFAAWCRAARIAVVHATDLPANIFALPAAALARVPVRVGNRREVVANRSAAEVVLQRLGYAFAHRVVANSRAAADRLAAERVPSRRITVIPNGLELATVAPRSRSRRPPRRVVVVANLRKEKRHDVLIDAAPLVLARFPDATFEIVGDGPERQRLEERARARGVAAAVTFSGHREDVATRLQASDVFVLCSESEAFPNALLEAMSAGLPAVASDAGGIPELLADQQTGLLTPIGDPSALADRICRVMADADLAARFGAAARTTVEAHYSFERMTAAFERLYLSELALRGGRYSREAELESVIGR
jgi:glycosyltransferase involved in cell wall biosynthesis